MSEFLGAASILLGAIGAVTGVVALYLTYKSQKPNLNVRVKYCSHHYQKSEMFDSQMEIRFFSGLEIGNHGIRGTTVNKIGLSFVDNGDKHILEDNLYGKQIKAMISSGEEVVRIEARWIRPFETIYVTPILVEEFKGTQKEEIYCNFTVYCTHKNYKVRFKSKKDDKFTP